ncbi:MAG: rhomboid family intramembrane serine protease [Epsilonproteobacteria bacterium]|nr:MAG: rhomboid family intramembrane serine protease [Campylobacterota bacterium]
MIQNKKILTLTNIIILLNIIMFGIQNSIEYGNIYFGLNIYFFKNEFYYQLLSTMFVHGGIAHILMNMFVLYQFGNMIEQYLGKFKYLLLYFVGGILTSIGSLAYMFFTGDWVNLVGASGAISVLLGWFALKDIEQRKGIIIWVALISFAPLLLGLPIAWYSHLIGFALGWIMGYFL